MQRRAKPLIVIEHLEPHFSKWIILEYRHAASIAGSRLVITNAKLGGGCRALIEKLGVEVTCFDESVAELEGELYSSRELLLVLDPQAEQLLEPSEAAEADAIVIGGILGDHPPRGRTRELLTSRLSGAKARSLGPHQLSIDGAVYVTSRVLEGARPTDIPLVVRPKIEVEVAGLRIEVELPFAYPRGPHGEPLLAPGLAELLAYGLAYEEYRLLNS